MTVDEPARTTPNNLEQLLRAEIESEVYEYRERTMFWPETGGITEEIARLATRGALTVMFGVPPDHVDTAAWTAVRAIQIMNEAGRQRDEARATVARARALLDRWLLMTLEPGQVRRLLDELTAVVDGPVSGETTKEQSDA